MATTRRWQLLSICYADDIANDQTCGRSWNSSREGDKARHENGPPTTRRCCREIYHRVPGSFPRAPARILAPLSPADFVDKLHQQIFAAFIEQQARSGEVDPALVGKATNSAGYLLTLRDDVATSVHATCEAAKIIEARRKRQIISIIENAGDAAKNGHTSSDLLKMLLADIEDCRRDEASHKPQFPLITANRISNGPISLNYLIDRVLVEKQPCVLGGPKKTLKTTLAILFAIHIALAIDLFGKFPVDRPRRVLVCSAESGMATIQEIAHRICDALGVKLAEIGNLVFTASVPKPNDAESFIEFRAAVAESQCEVLILDPFYRMFDGDGQESIFKMGVVLGKIDDLCQEFGVTLILCHHLKTSRMNQFAPAELDDLAYAGCAEYFRQWLLLSRREAYELGSGKHALWLTIGGGAGHNSLWALDIDEGHSDNIGGRLWTLGLKRADEGHDAAERRKAAVKADANQKQFDDDRAAVFRIMAKFPGGLSKTDIGTRAAISNRRWNSVFARMLDDEELVPIKITVSNHKKPITGYKLKG